MPAPRSHALAAIAADVHACHRCPRLVAHREGVARVKRRAYQDWEYWGKPVAGFGDPAARLLVIGLAPGAHGANRTGRMFTGDSSGDLLYWTLHHAGFASQPASTSRDDRLRLSGAYITAAVRCAPPDNRPTPEEFRRCQPFLEQELAALTRVQVVVALGKLAFDTYTRILDDQGAIEARRQLIFGHGRRYDLEKWASPKDSARTGKRAARLPVLLACYHPSRQNTQSGRLTKQMFLKVFQNARKLIAI